MKKIILMSMFLILSILFILPLVGIFSKSLNYQVWRYILTSNEIYSSLITTILVTFLVILINFIIGTPIAAVMAKTKFRGKILVEVLIVSPLVIPSMVSTMGLQFLFIKLNLIETVLGVAIVHSVVTLPYYIQSVRMGYSSLNKSYDSLGKILGANKFEIFTKITIPLIYPSFVVGISLTIIVSLAQYLITFIIGGGQVVTLPILLMPYLNEGATTGSVYSIIYIIFTYFLVILLNKITKMIFRKRD
ncbi:MAG: ABC transporter permease [Cetobacterium sp.]